MEEMKIPTEAVRWRTDYESQSVEGAYEQVKSWQAFPLVHGVTLRTGGLSTGPYEGFNMGLHVGDDPQVVAIHRGALAEHVLGVPVRDLTCGEQTHELTVRAVTKEDTGRGALQWEEGFPRTDALHTNEVGVPLLTLVADCVPVMIYDATHHALAVVHAGWKGALGHLPLLTLKSMKEAYDTEPNDCHIYMGPAIGGQSFEVSEDIATQFIEDMATWLPLQADISGEDEADAKRVMAKVVAQVSGIVQYFQEEGAAEKTPHINLRGYMASYLVEAGVPEGQITASPVDTKRDRHCYSYRGDGGTTGRMAMFGMLKEKP